jgi:hypothetical protein
MYTNAQIDQFTLDVLMHAAPGKDPNGRPKALCAYQVCSSYDDTAAAHLITLGGAGGADGKSGAGPAFTQVVQHSLKRLEQQGLVRHFYMDTRGLAFDIKGHRVVPSYPVMAVYQYTDSKRKP